VGHEMRYHRVGRPESRPAYPREASLRGLAGLNVRIAGLGGLPERIAFSACASVLPSAIDALRGLRLRSSVFALGMEAGVFWRGCPTSHLPNGPEMLDQPRGARSVIPPRRECGFVTKRYRCYTTRENP
jgi:hypothetical protein